MGANPYVQDRPEMIKSVIVYLDILGFSTRVEEACNHGRGNQLLLELHDVLKGAQVHINPSKFLSSDERPDSHTLKVFTDNIVLGFPILGDPRDRAEPEFGAVFTQVAWYHLDLAMHGFFLRGGLTEAEHYMDEEIVYGPGLLEAVRLEKEAEFPRIILSAAAVKRVREHLKFYGKVAFAPHNDVLAISPDGRMFLNYLSRVNVDDEYGPIDEWLNKHRKNIKHNLDTQSNSHILAKYQWLASYHNWYCQGFPHLSKKLLLPAPALAFRQLSEVY